MLQLTAAQLLQLRLVLLSQVIMTHLPLVRLQSVNFTKYKSNLSLGPMAGAVQAEAMDTAPDFPDRNPNASGVRARRPADLVRPVHPMCRYFVVTIGACVGIFDTK